VSEIIILDPSEVATGRTELNITSGAITVDKDGVNWGDAAIQAYMAEQERGSAPVDFRIPNREIQIPLVLQTSGTVTLDQARDKLQKKVSRIQQEGGWLKRVLTGTGGTVFADVVNATLQLPGGWMQAHRATEPEATLSLEAIPDFYGSEITLSDHVETTATELVFTETGIKGDYPGRVRLMVDNDQATDQLGAFWCFRSRYYDAAATAALKYEAEALGPISPASAVGTATLGSGSNTASGGTAVRNGTVLASWMPVMNTNIGGTAYLTHKGTYKVYGRVFSTSGTALDTRLVWDVGDLVNPAENDAWRVPGANNFYIADYGEIRIDETGLGTHRWQGQIQARSEAGTENIAIDKLWFVNEDDGSGKLQAVTAVAEGATFSNINSAGTAVDDASVGTIAWSNPTNVLVSDNAWATAAFTGAGQQSHYLKATNFGFAIPTGVTITGIVVEVERSANKGNTVRDQLTSNRAVRLVKGGAISGTGHIAAPSQQLWSTAESYVSYGEANDLWGLSWIPSDINASTFGVVVGAEMLNPDTATARIDHVRITVHYLYTPVVVSDAVAYASQSVELGTQGIYREDVGGTASGPVSVITGDLPRIPPAGAEGRTTEVMVKLSRGDLDQLPDTNVDDLSARISYRPSWLQNPGL
jgi:hypothetical protein